VVVLLAVALAGALLVLTWVMALRAQVERQTVLLRESEERFRHMAQHDALTGLVTRLVLQDRLTVALGGAARRQTGLALFMLDLDRFKDINDAFGHIAGDEVLRVTAERLLKAVRHTDTVARVGGDEFVVLLPDLTDPHIAEKMAANIVRALSTPISFAGQTIPVSASVGVCTSFAGAVDGEALLKSADAALYMAKEQGRNRFHVSTVPLRPPETDPAVGRIGPDLSAGSTQIE
jgi:diguanylate cyclase (GGDEF)-like protein